MQQRKGNRRLGYLRLGRKSSLLTLREKQLNAKRGGQDNAKEKEKGKIADTNRPHNR